MQGPPIRLGALIKAYRENVGLTQHELAKRLSPPVSRSLIAHVEQGLRIPPAPVLARLCSTLGIPLPLWEHYRAPGFAGGASHRTAPPERTTPRLVAMAGLMGSGKTTLARGLAAALGFASLPEAAQGIRYLDDLARDRPRWAFEAQLAFLSTKAVQLRELHGRGRSVILDRSLSEDINVFAAHFRQRGDIDDRAYATYTALAQHFILTLPQPDLLVYCACHVEEAWRRIQARGRADGLHTKEHVAQIGGLYERWIAEQQESIVLAVDSQQYDFRDSLVVQAIAAEVERRISDESRQLDLFQSPGASPITIEPSRTQAFATQKAALRELSPHPVAYLAAPFTGVASTRAAATAAGELFDAAHGVIPPGRYRSALLAIERTLRDLGIRTIIPHRDVNAWGRKTLTPTAAAQQCAAHVSGADCVVALLGASHGAHFEVGLGMGLGKPTIVVECDELNSSFIARGISSMQRADFMSLHCDQVSQAAATIARSSARDFLGRYFPVQPVEEGT